MPIYEYQCTGCNHHFDTIQTFEAVALIHCPVCGEPKLKKLISAPAFHLKGTGWYATDFKNPQAKPNSEAPISKEEETKKESKKENVEKSESSKEAKGGQPNDTSSTTKKVDNAD